MANDAVITIRTTEEVKQRFKDVADVEGISLTAWILEQAEKGAGGAGCAKCKATEDAIRGLVAQMDEYFSHGIDRAVEVLERHGYLVGEEDFQVAGEVEPPKVTGKSPKELVKNPIKTQEDAKAAIEKLDKPKRAMITTKGGKMNSAGKMYTGEKVTYAGKPAWVVRDVNGRESMTFEAPPEG